jgi:hypothetical protein
MQAGRVQAEELWKDFTVTISNCMEVKDCGVRRVRIRGVDAGRKSTS